MTTRTPLVLLPGLLCDGALWQAQIDALADIADPIVADLTQDDSMTGMAERILTAAPSRFALAGLSMGGYVAQEIMRRAPERILKLALVDTSARADRPEQSARRRGLLELAEKGQFKGVTPMLLPTLIYPDRLQDKALTDTVIGMAKRIGRDGFLRQQRAVMGRIDGRPYLKDIACPTLVLCGREDALTPVKVHIEMAELVPGAALEIVEECGHLAPLERPAEVTAAMRKWLAS